MKGLGVAIISTSKGVMTDRQARKEKCWRRGPRIYLVNKGVQKCLELEENP